MYQLQTIIVGIFWGKESKKRTDPDSGFKSQELDPDRRKKPDPSGFETLILFIWRDLKSVPIAEQYSNYTVEVEGERLHLNGINTQGENIADNGGVKEALRYV